MFSLYNIISADGEYRDFEKCLKETAGAKKPLPIAVNGLTGGALGAFICSAVTAVKALGKKTLILTPDLKLQEKLTSLLLDCELGCVGYKPRDFVFNNTGASHDIERERLSALFSVMTNSCDAVISSPSAVLGYTMPKQVLEASSFSVSAGDTVSPDALCERLSSIGFKYSETVENAGQYARRGGIVDFFDGLQPYPVRLEFFGDEIDRMVYFDPITQRAGDACPSVKLLPTLEVIPTVEARGKMHGTVCSLIKKAKTDTALQRLNQEKSILESDITPDFRDKYLGLIYPECQNLLSYLDGECVVLIIGTSAFEDDVRAYIKSINTQREGMLKDGAINESSAKYCADEEMLSGFLNRNLPVHINSFSGTVGSIPLAGLFGFRCRRTVAYGENTRMLLEDIAGYRKSGYRVILACESAAGAGSLSATLADEGISAIPAYSGITNDISSMQGGSVYITVNRCDGYDLPTPKIAVLSMARDEGRAVMANRRRQLIRRKIGNASQRLMSYSDLSVGDYVVHENYGIGMYEGVETVTVDGFTKDYIRIRYAGTDKLLIPCDKLEMIGKYIGKNDDSGQIKLSRMGGGDWLKTKARVKSAVKDIAGELIKLYAERQRLPGFAFPADCSMEEEFASSFAYDETDSQLVATEEIKRDMMRSVPMNRLLCGDVGFGKTEVALRAAFKAIMGSKQVAILVPTTILAMQHYQTAQSRMRDYPITVEMLTRFKSPKEQEQILRRAKRGEIDILIGTHKLLSKNLEFRDLGLLIVDEEQRFGVSQKEKLKQMFKNIDVLTLSATPIPRTLNMAMNGISDISVLDEAPGERRPVQTYVSAHDDILIDDAIERELARGGQVLYLYNKVEDIVYVAAKISKAHPEARVAYAHGKMTSDELEDIWSGLVMGEIDIIVCTTIIETGIDLPNANTLIIENADRFGLSQLHQIRGRVGRSERQAYAYLTYRKGKTLSEIAERRLSAIREFAEFGAGFKVALRDLEIRGAGNLLGAEQHGYIEGVGYELYLKLLNEAVLESEGKLQKKPDEALIDIKTSAYIPERYIQNGGKRMEMYKKISLITLPVDHADVYDEFTDRYGDMPREVERLLNVALAKSLATRFGIKRIRQVGGAIWFACDAPDLSVWSELFAAFPALSFKYSPEGALSYRLKTGEDATMVAAEVMKKYLEIVEGDEKNENASAK